MLGDVFPVDSTPCRFSGLAWDYQGHVTLPCCILSTGDWRTFSGQEDLGDLFEPVFIRVIVRNSNSTVIVLMIIMIITTIIIL